MVSTIILAFASLVTWVNTVRLTWMNAQAIHAHLIAFVKMASIVILAVVLMALKVAIARRILMNVNQILVNIMVKAVNRHFDWFTCVYFSAFISRVCSLSGNCTDEINDYACSCVQGWVGKNCSSNYDECAGQPCRNNGTCHDGINNYNVSNH